MTHCQLSSPTHTHAQAFLSAYPRNIPEFGIGRRTQANRDWYARYVASAVKVPEDAVGREWLSTHPAQAQNDDFWAFAELAKTAKEHGIYLSVGVIERSLIGSTVWCTNLIFGADGRLLAKHRKLKPTGAERMIWHEGEDVNPVTPHGDAAAEAREADNMPVVQTSIGKMGAVICWESESAVCEQADAAKTTCLSRATSCTRRVSRCEYTLVTRSF
jgi:predicted amidohydrolase